MMHPSDRQWWKTHSADYVLGLLSNSERLVFERIMPTEPELQDFVIEWREKLQPMSDALPPMQPPDHILPALISNLATASNDNLAPQAYAKDQDGDSYQDDSQVHRNSSVQDDYPASEDVTSNGTAMVVGGAGDGLAHRSDASTRLYLNPHADAASLADGTAFMRMVEKKQKGIDGWRSFAGLATAACLLMAVLGWMGFQKVQTDKVEPTFDAISVVQNDDAKALWIVDSSASNKKLRVTAIAPPVIEAGQAFELWMVKPNDGGVVSMGLLPSEANASSLVKVPGLSANAQSFSVSLEPAEGSPESIPSGRVLYHGAIQPLSD